MTDIIILLVEILTTRQSRVICITFMNEKQTAPKTLRKTWRAQVVTLESATRSTVAPLVDSDLPSYSLFCLVWDQVSFKAHLSGNEP